MITSLVKHGARRSRSRRDSSPATGWVRCDRCGASGPKSQGRVRNIEALARRAAAADGFTRADRGDGQLEDLCPECASAAPVARRGEGA